MNEVVERIFSLLKEQNKRAIDLCNKTGLATSTLSMWKKTDRKPDLQSLTKIAAYFEVPIEYLLTGNMDGYFINDEVAQIAQELFERPEMRVLFDSSKNMSKETILQFAEIMKKVQGESDDD